MHNNRLAFLFFPPILNTTMYGDLKRELMSSTFSNIFIILRHNLEFNNKYFLFKFSN